MERDWIVRKPLPGKIDEGQYGVRGILAIEKSIGQCVVPLTGNGLHTLIQILPYIGDLEQITIRLTKAEHRDVVAGYLYNAYAFSG